MAQTERAGSAAERRTPSSHACAPSAGAPSTPSGNTKAAHVFSLHTMRPDGIPALSGPVPQVMFTGVPEYPALHRKLHRDGGVTALSTMPS